MKLSQNKKINLKSYLILIQENDNKYKILKNLIPTIVIELISEHVSAEHFPAIQKDYHSQKLMHQFD